MSFIKLTENVWSHNPRFHKAWVRHFANLGDFIGIQDLLRLSVTDLAELASASELFNVSILADSNELTRASVATTLLVYAAGLKVAAPKLT